MTDEAFSFAFGWNGFGQVGTTGTRQQVNEPERLELRTDDIEAAAAALAGMRGVLVWMIARRIYDLRARP